MRLDYISARGDILPLVNNKYFIAKVEGLTAATASISSVVVGGIDGDTVNNMQAQPRPIIIDLTIRPEADVEEAKREILKVVKLKKQGSLLWEHKGRTITISGKVESIEMPRFVEKVIMQISMYCEQPFWEDVADIVSQISEAIDLHYFTDNNADMLYFPVDGIVLGEYDTIRTKTVYNAGDVDIGLDITIFALDTVTNPIIYDKHGNYFGVGYAARPVVMSKGDSITITTKRKNKSVKMNGAEILDRIKPFSTWLQLETGDNTFSINSDDESLTNMYFTMVYKQRYI